MALTGCHKTNLREGLLREVALTGCHKTNLREGLLREVALSSRGVEPVEPRVRDRDGPSLARLVFFVNYITKKRVKRSVVVSDPKMDQQT